MRAPALTREPRSRVRVTGTRRGPMGGPSWWPPSSSLAGAKTAVAFGIARRRRPVLGPGDDPRRSAAQPGRL